MVNEGMSIEHVEEGSKWNVSIVRQDTTEIQFIESISDLVSILAKPENFFLVDSTVSHLFAPQLQPLLPPTRTMRLDGGDKHKNWEQLRLVIDSMYAKNIPRSGRIVSIGGGVVSDLGGLAANLYFRGIKAVHVPTTLLAMVDAAIGGKVGVNHPEQKNLIGSFYQPEQCLLCLEFLRTLPAEEFRSALGEVLKIAIVSSPKLFEQLEYYDSDSDPKNLQLKSMIAECIVQKTTILGENCYERSFSRILNFGHTVGHPIEDISHFHIKHGIAVGIGIAIASHISFQRRILSQVEFSRIERLMKKLGLPSYDRSIGFDQLWHHVEKLILQRGGKSLLYVIPVKIGVARVVDSISPNELSGAIRYFCEESEHAIIGEATSIPICANE